VAQERIDEIEEGLSRWLGDIAAHQVGRVLRGAAGWGERAGKTLTANVREYLQEESRDLVPRAEMAQYCAGVSEVRDSVDALATRIQKLTEQARKSHE
jgi:ubiquinone biosynthesis accessory factor UbiJ